VTRLWAGRPGFDSEQGQVFFFFFTTAYRPIVGPNQSALQWVQGFPSPGVKRSGRETNHSSPSNAEVKNARSGTSTPPHVFMA